MDGAAPSRSSTWGRLSSSPRAGPAISGGSFSPVVVVQPVIGEPTEGGDIKLTGFQELAVECALMIGAEQEFVDLLIDAQRGLFEDLSAQIVGGEAYRQFCLSRPLRQLSPSDFLS